MSKKIKILYVHHAWGINGSLFSLLYLLNELDKNTYSPKIVCLYRSEASELFEKNGFEVIYALKYNNFFAHHEKGKLKLYNLYSLIKTTYHWVMSAFFVAPKVFQKVHPDIVHLNSDVLSSWAFAAKRSKLKVVCHNRDPIAKGHFGFRRFILRKILNYSVTKFISISKDNAKRLGLEHKTTVIYNFVNFNKFNINKVKNHTNVNESQVLFLGGMHKAKGFDILADSLKYLNNNIKIILCGYYGKSSKLKLLLSKMHKKLKIAKSSKNVKILGVVKDIENIIDSVDIILFPATIPHFARPIIEAGAMGKPVIASDLPGMDEIVIQDFTGLLIKPNDPVALADAINELCRDQERRKIMGLNGYKRARELFDSKKNTKKIEKFYEELIKG